ncbi:MAG: hypothetical protein JOZ42_05110 [Acetobacteraceae bacterium]|nr:hypothetical protein [Acetobacteraceae bacterium]
MKRSPKLVLGLLALVAVLAVGPLTIWAETGKPAVHKPDAPQAETHHRIVFQISQNDPAAMNVALNNAENLSNFYKSRGETVEMEFVAYGPGLAMVRSDTSPVKDRLAAMTNSTKNLVVSGCGNTMSNQSKQENKEISLLPEARVVPTGIGRIVELQEQGWTYVRP